MKTVHTFDPNGDLVFLLPEVSEAKAVEEETTGTISSRNRSSNGAVTPSEASDDGQSEMNLEPPLDIHMLVSSRHMMLASRVFSAMLQHSNFQEGQTLASTGRVDIPLPEDDPESFIILLNIIHGRSRKVPRTVDLELLTKLAISVDKYELHEVVEVYSYSWIDTLPKTYTEENALPWLAISWVFDLKEEFRAVTKVIERSASSDLMDILGNISPHLPIPGRIIEAILTRRQQVLFCLFNTIELQAKVYQGSVLCDRKDGKEDRKSACDAMVLGSLLKGAMESGLWPIQPPPYAGFNVNNVMSAVRCLTIVALCDEIDRWYEAKTAPSSYSNRYSYGTPTHVQTHGVKQAIEEHVDLQEERLCGFDIDDFKAEKKS